MVCCLFQNVQSFAHGHTPKTTFMDLDYLSSKLEVFTYLGSNVILCAILCFLLANLRNSMKERKEKI